MRFEIKTGGVAVILVGLTILSGAVFVLGLIAGYEIAGQNQPNESQVATVYQLPGKPAAASSAVASAPSAESSRSGETDSAAGAHSTPPEREVSDTLPPPAESDSYGVASHPKAPDFAGERGVVAAPALGVATGNGERPRPPAGSAVASAPPYAESGIGNPAGESTGAVKGNANPAKAPAATSAIANSREPIAAIQRRRGYTIQLDAAMDRAGAQAMVRRLRGLGYQSFIVAGQINGSTWYRVRVGPYQSAAQAQAAQAQLRQRYNTAYSSR